MFTPKFVDKQKFFSRYHNFDSFTKDLNYNKQRRLNFIDPDKRLPVDQYHGQDFALSSHGWPMSDIALLAKAQTQQELDLAISRLRQLNIQGVDTSGKSVAEVLHDIVPRWCQTPSELQRYAKYYTSFVSSVQSDKADDDKKDTQGTEES